MRIVGIDVHPLVCALPSPYGDANGPKYYRACIVVEVRMDNGITGLGETTGRLPLIVAEANYSYGRVIGMDATNIREVLRVLGDVSNRVRAGLEVALWDALARQSGLPLYKFLGGSKHRTIPLYGSLQNIPFGPNPQEPLSRHALFVTSERLALQAVQAGFRMIKMKIGASSLVWDIENIENVRAALPSTISFAVDANEALDGAAAVRVARCLERTFGVKWFEEPLPLTIYDGYKHLRDKSDVPIAGGENAQSITEFAHLIRHGCLDILTPDLLHVGGIDATRDVIALASANGLRVSPHSFDGGIARWAAIHVFAGVGPIGKGPPEEAYDPIEWDFMPNPFTEQVILSSHQIVHGSVVLSERPGLGIELNRPALEQWRYHNQPIVHR